MNADSLGFEEYRRDIFDFDRFDLLAKEGFKERLGLPSEQQAIIGLITIAFNDLDRRLSEGIQEMLQFEGEIGDIITSELSFKVKVHIFSSLIKHLRSTYFFNRLQGRGFENEYIPCLTKALFKCEELRNWVLHSVYLPKCDHTPDTFLLQKITAKSSRGLVKFVEEVEISRLINISEFTVSMKMELDDFFIDFHKI